MEVLQKLMPDIGSNVEVAMQIMSTKVTEPVFCGLHQK